MDGKGAIWSKINWIGACLAMLGLFSDPDFVKVAGELVPQEILSKAISGCGLALIVIRTFFTSANISGIISTPKKEE